MCSEPAIMSEAALDSQGKTDPKSGTPTCDIQARSDLSTLSVTAS